MPHWQALDFNMENSAGEMRANTSLRPHILEIPAGADILSSVSDYARRRRRAVSVLAASGAVSGITLREPAGPAPLRGGHFEILSITGTVMPPPAPPDSAGLAVFVAGGDGRVIGGRVAGPIVAAGPVILTVAVFAGAVCERLPPPAEADE